VESRKEFTYMSKVLATSVNGETVYIEVEGAYGSEETAAVGETLEKARDAFEQAKTTIVNVTKSMISAIQTLERETAPDQFELKFGVKFSAEGQAILVKAGLEATLDVTITYKR
jgi:Trypsin-co-occurring domain 1